MEFNTMEQLYHQTNRIIQELQQCFQDLHNPQKDIEQAENEILHKINTVNSNCDRLDVLVFKVPVSQRPNAKMRVDQLKYDIRHLINALQLWKQKRQKRQIEIDEREQLLNHRFLANPETQINIDSSLEAKSSLNNAHRGVDEMIFTGGNILDSLRGQRETLKGAKKRILSIGNTLGLSNHVLKLIEKRLSDDKTVLLFGMFLTMLVIIIVIYIFIL